MKKTIYDISVEISKEMVTWPSDPVFSSEKIKEIGKKNKCNLSALHCGTHTGTHLDAPFHFFNKGITVDRIRLEGLVNLKCLVRKVKGREIGKDNIKDIFPCRYGALLFKTDNSSRKLLQKRRFTPDYTYLSESAAEHIAGFPGKLKILGIDYLSIEKRAGSGAVHRALLGNNICILEAVDLSAVPEGEYLLTVLPLKIKNADSAPARAFLIRN